ncbi:MAG: PEP/pyruvate-binding domain-containing protein [Patescibacteria group bacterium]
MWTKRFQELGKDDANIAGGKGASLGEMTRAGIPVPGGFVVVAGAFEHFITSTSLKAEIEELLKPVSIENSASVDLASEKIQERILNNTHPIPTEMANEIMDAFGALNAEFVAVRSSATVEDGPDAAWAGQLDTYLNTTKEHVLQNVRRCWASLYTPRAIFYRYEKNLGQTDISVSVVIQKMVQSDASGVAFSVDPVTEDHNHLFIEGAWGLGEAVVGGHVTPDAYVISKQPREIIEKNIASQEKGLYKKQTGDSEWRDIPSEKREAQKLADEHILHLADVIEMIEKHYGRPQDIEWAIENGTLYILQSRPITTLSK